ncbi:MAG: YceD family protein [Betaproteobacteria bacterium]
MSLTINVDRFTRQKQSIAGSFLPCELLGLAEYLAGSEGEINYSLLGNSVVDLSGKQDRRVKCIIYGWLLLFDPVTLVVVRHPLDIASSLVLVKDESDLPPLEMESEGEDYIVCGVNMDVAERVEEEILLSLPAHAVSRKETNDSRGERAQPISSKPVKSAKAIQQPAEAGKKISPFAKLVELKKK